MFESIAAILKVYRTDKYVKPTPEHSMDVDDSIGVLDKYDGKSVWYRRIGRITWIFDGRVDAKYYHREKELTLDPWKQESTANEVPSDAS